MILYNSIAEVPAAVAPDITVEVFEFNPKRAVEKTIVTKREDEFSFCLLQESELAERRTNYDTFAQMIEGVADIMISDKRYKLKKGEGIIVPSNVTYRFHSTGKFKVIFTVITNERYQ